MQFNDSPDPDFFALSYAELKAQVRAEHTYGVTDEVWRAVYQTPTGLTPPGGAGLAGNPVANQVRLGLEPKSEATK